MKNLFWFSIIVITLGFAPFLHAQTAPNVDLIWEADSYVPAEYQGKPLAVVGSNLRIVALSDATDLEYYWRLDDYELPDYSGLNKNRFTFKVTKTAGQTHTVYLIIKKGGQNIASRTLEIPIIDPQIKFYEQDPILGEVFNRNFSGVYQLPKSEITFVAEPFFFNRADANNLNYTWKLNNQKVAPDSGSGRVITFITPTSGGQGDNLVELLVENPNNVLQYIKNSFSLTFNFNSFNNDTSF